MKVKKLMIIVMFIIGSLLFIPNTVKAVDATETTLTSENDIVEWSYELVDGVITDLRAKNDNKSDIKGILTVPSKIDGYTVAAIGNSAFWGYNSLTKIVLPETVTQIDMMAFYECTSLVDINIPENVETIGDMAFYGCSSLTEITLPAKVSELGGAVFYLCTNLEKLTILNPNLSIYSHPFLNCNKLTVYAYPASSISGCVGTTVDNDIKFSPIYKTDLIGLTNITAFNETIDDGSGTMIDYQVTLQANSGYKLPEEVSVYIGENKTEYFVYDNTTGELSINWGYIDGDIKIVAEAKQEYKISLDLSEASIYSITMNGTNFYEPYVIVEPNTECTFEVQSDDWVILDSITSNGTEILKEKNKQFYSFKITPTADTTIKIVTKEFASYDFMVVVNEGENVIVYDSETVSAFDNRELNSYLAPAQNINSVNKITKYKNGTEKEETMSDVTNIVFENDYNIESVTITIETDSPIIKVNNIQELQKALNGDKFAKINGNTITLLQNVVINEKTILIESGEYSIDLNGKEIVNENQNIQMAIIELVGDTKLTIKDSSNGKGKIYSSNLVDYAIFAAGNSNLTIDGGNYEGHWDGVRVSDEANVIVNNGKMTGDQGSGLEIYGNSNVVINGGQFNSNKYAGINVEYDLRLDNFSSPTVKILGGNFKGILGIVSKTITEDSNPVKVTNLLQEGYMFNASENVEVKTLQQPGAPFFWISYTNNPEVNVKKEAFKVIFDANGGTFAEDKLNFTIDEWKIGDEENLKKPVREGYEFVGYFTEKTGGTSLEKYIAEAGVDGNLTFYAQWKEKENDSTGGVTGDAEDPEGTGSASGGNENEGGTGNTPEQGGNSEGTGSTPGEIENSGTPESEPGQSENSGTAGDTSGDKEENTGNTGDTSEDKDQDAGNTEEDSSENENTNSESANTGNINNSNSTNKPNLKNPQTGDNIELFIAVLLVSTVGLVIAIKLKKHIK